MFDRRCLVQPRLEFGIFEKRRDELTVTGAGGHAGMQVAVEMPAEIALQLGRGLGAEFGSVESHLARTGFGSRQRTCSRDQPPDRLIEFDV